MIQACVYGINQQQFPALESMVYGTNPITESTLNQAMSLFDCDFVQGFGLTELAELAGYSYPISLNLLASCPEILRVKCLKKDLRKPFWEV